VSGLLQRIADGEVILGDGAMGTLLFQRGIAPNECPEAINLRSPEILVEIASAYLAAGADIIQTNTFGGSPLKLAQYGLDDRTEDINRIAVEIVRSVVGEKALVSGSCGPCGRILIPYGDTAPEEVYQSFVTQAGALLSAGVDIICIETMIDITETTLAIRAVRSLDSSIPIISTMTFNQTPRGFFTIMGVNIEKAAKEMEKAGASIVGSNCGFGIDLMIKIAREFRAHSSLPIIIQSNAGLPEIVKGKPVYSETPEFMASRIPELIASGVSIIGGCCGTTPEHIGAFRAAIDAMSGQ